MSDSHTSNGLTPSLSKQPAGSLEDLMPGPNTTTLTGTEILSDLLKMFQYLKTNLREQREGKSLFLKTPVQALLYAEQVAIYAMQDYPRHVEGRPFVTKLWDTLQQIQQVVSEWRTQDQTDNGETELTIIEAIVENTLREHTRTGRMDVAI